MKQRGLYLDEDTQSSALVEALRARGLNVVTTSELGMNNRDDAEQLRLATDRGLVVATSNIADFARLHHAWQQRSLDHAGIILIPQQRWGPGELARRIARLLAALPGDAMHNRLEFIHSL